MKSSQKASPVFTYGLLRHGETVWNRERRVQGHCDSPLTSQGRKQITAWADFLADGGWQHILSSDLGRVRETVAILNATLQLPVTEDTRLRELNWGDWEGLNLARVQQDWAEELAAQVSKGWDFRPPGGESRREVRDRALMALTAAQGMPGVEKLLVVCHLGVIKCLLYSVAGREFLPGEPTLIEKSCLHHLIYKEGGYRLGTLNISAGVTES